MPRKQSNKDEIIGLRVTRSLKQALQKEADAQGLDMTSYIRHLLTTDPRRKKMVEK